MVNVTRYRRKRSGMSKRARTTDLSRRKRYTRRKKTGKSGFLKAIRWSNLNTTANCHLQMTGDDVLTSGDGATVFKLTDCNSYLEFVNLFDNYRVVKVLYRFVLIRNPSEYSGTIPAAKGLYPRLTWCHDFNDSTPVNRSFMIQKANMREFFFTDNAQKTRWYTLNPSVLGVTYETLAASSYAPKWRQWLDTGDSNCPHYGIKYNYSELYTGIAIRMECKYILECKGVS